MVQTEIITDRELRTKAHQALRQIFTSHLESSTDADGAMIITAAYNQKKGRNTSNRDQGFTGQTQKINWKDLGGEHLHFSLYKENRDTMEAISFLARQLHIKPGDFKFAGTKDRRAVTVQRVSVYKAKINQMINIGKKLIGARIGNFEYQQYGLELGDLCGNEFLITLRDCHSHEPITGNTDERLANWSMMIEKAVDMLNKRGFLNYFGLQRFGTFSVRTDVVGMKMLKGDFKGAIEAILDYDTSVLSAGEKKPAGNDSIARDEKSRAFAIHKFQTTGNTHPAIDELPRKYSAESSIIYHLGNKKNRDDYIGALKTIPRNLRLIYCHAYQSRIWNLAASQRWSMGDGVLAGDLVLVNEHSDKLNAVETGEQIDTDGEKTFPPAEEDCAVDPKDRFIRARVLSEDEAQSGQYTIFDVVLPTPGFDVLYPQNALHAFYEETMAAAGGLSPHDMRRSWRDISLSGSYRKLIVRPVKVDSAVHAYTRDNEQFIETDLDRMDPSRHRQGRAPREEGGEQVIQEEKEIAGGGVEDVNTEVKIAVVLNMQLGASQYATMALRELMKEGGFRAYKPEFGGGR